MIIIISISNDGTTNEVINWITHLSDEKILRINLDVDEVKLLKFDDDEKKFIIQVNSIEHNLYECTLIMFYFIVKILIDNKVYIIKRITI